ncbi:unnamed protein product [Rotaria sp. Silwood1]|nr:unnamed protein product [Rotaria sp. Silwood1]
METTRRCQMKLLDDRKLELSVNNKQTVTDLINEISRQYHLTETEYFGVYYEENDERMWLPSDKKLFDQEVFKRDSSPPVLYFAVRFVFKSFLWLQNATTVMLFFLSTRYAIYRGIIDTNDNTLFQLAGLVVQAVAGDYTNDEAAINIIKRACVLPKRVVERNISRRYCEDQIINHYKACRELVRGLCIVKYMMLAENLPSYGSHYFLVRNKNNVYAYLGISFIGISVYNYHDRETPVKIYYWRQLENLYYRDRKFSLEVHDLETTHFLSSSSIPTNVSAPETDDKLIDAIHDPSTQMSTGRRIPPTPNIKVRAWFTNSPQYCKAIWSMAVSQHQFYLDKRSCRQNQSLQINDLVRELTNSSITLTIDNMIPNGSLSRSNTSTNVIQNEQIEADVEQLMDLMKTRKQQLESLLNEKMKDFGLICVLENQVTGGASDDHVNINDSGIQQELKYHVVDELLNEQVQERAKLSQLKQEHDIQSKIVICAKKLLHDQAKGNSNLLDSVLKQRFEFYTCVKEKLDRLTKLIDTVQKEINSRYPYAESSPIISSTATSGSPSSNSYVQRYQQQQNSPSPTQQLNRTSSYKRALVNNQRSTPSAVIDGHSSEFDNQVLLSPPLDRSQSFDRLVSGLPPDSSNNRQQQQQQQHTAYILQPPPMNSSNNASRNRIRDRKQQPNLRQAQKTTSTSNAMPDEQTQQQLSHMRSLDRRHIRGVPHNSSINSTISKTHMKSSHTDIYGSLERNKHSKVSQPALHGTIINDENDRINKNDNQAHDFYHLTPTLPTQTNTTSTVVNVGNVLQQQQQAFDHIDSTPPPLPVTSSSNRSRRPPPSVFQPHFDSSLSSSTTIATPKDSYYTISGSKDVSTHPHTHIRGLVAENFYNGTYTNKPPPVPPQQQPQSMQRYDTSPLLVRRLEHMNPSQTRYQSQSYNRTQSSSMVPTSQVSTSRLNTNNQNQSSALLFRPHSSQSSSSQSSGPNSGSLHVAEEFSDDVLACGFLFGSDSGPEWKTLSTTWGPNPLSHHYYVKQPLTIEDAKKDGFEQISNSCQGKFIGQRFIKDRDFAVILIYDSKGFIAGIQMGIPASMINDTYYKYSQQKMFNRDTILGVDVYILTAYFIDPKTICTSDENTNYRDRHIVGTGLWLQNGINPISDSTLIPINQTDADKTKWVKGACFPSMGVHYWYDNRLDSDCETYFPSFLLYNKGKLTGFGWALFGKYDFTKRTEFPPLSAISSFLKPVPTCMPVKFHQVGGFTTMHIYFNTDPWNLIC